MAAQDKPNLPMSLAELRTQLAEKLQSQRATLPPPTSSRIKPIAKEGFLLPSGDTAETIDAVVVDMRYVNALYLKPYKDGVIETPSCWAVGSDANAMAPHSKSESPVSDACDGCPHNEWGSGTNGVGKKCKNGIRLAMLPLDATEKTQVLSMDLPPTSMKSFIGILRKLKDIPFQLIAMNFSLDPKVKYPLVVSTAIGDLPDHMAPLLPSAMERSQEMLNRGFDYGD
jgi:hypothetical protein